jgi:predicted RNA binding protein YcfA (HicA-like mRNA interferase family)
MIWLGRSIEDESPVLLRDFPMPRKIRDYKAEIIKLGFVKRQGKGSHANWKHPELPFVITIAFRDGEDVPRYLEKLLAQAKAILDSQSESDE